MTISLCLVVWNELPGCQLDVPRLPREEFQEIYAVDGGSTDGTAEYLRAQGIRVEPQVKRGLNAAYWQGVEVSRCEAVVFFFPKGTLPTEDLRKFRPLLEAGHDLVVASRNVRGARNEEDTRWLKPRKWLVLALALASAAVWRREGPWIRDVLHGVKGVTVAGFRAMDPAGTGLSIDIETVVRSYRQRRRRVEFPTTERARVSGSTHFKIIPTGLKLLAYLRRELRRRD